MNLGLSHSAVRKSIFSGRSTSGFATVAQCANHPRGENGDNPVAPATFTLLQLTGKKRNAESTYRGFQRKRQEFQQQVARLVRKVKLGQSNDDFVMVEQF